MNFRSRARCFPFLAGLFIFLVVLPGLALDDFPVQDSDRLSHYVDDDEYNDEYDDGDMSYYGSEEEMTSPSLPPAPPKIEPRPPIDLAGKTILIGRIPYLSLKDMMAQARTLLRHIQKETGAKAVRLVTAQNYAGVLDALARDTIDFAWIGPSAYVLNRDRDKLLPIAKAKHLADPSYRGVFIARANGPVLGLDDVKGRVIGFVDPESASGYLYPLYVLQRLKIDPHKVSRVVFLKKHDAVVQAVLDGKIHVGVCLEATLESWPVPAQVRQILVLGRTDVIPSDVIVSRQDCPINLREKLTAALLSFTPPPAAGKDPAGLLPVPSFLPAADEEFDPVRTVLQAVKPLLKQP
jgi:phosphonate transport system substrate-binding protein